MHLPAVLNAWVQQLPQHWETRWCSRTYEETSRRINARLWDDRARTLRRSWLSLFHFLNLFSVTLCIFWDQWVEMPICFKTHTFCEYTHWFNDVFSLLFYLLTALNNFFAYSFLWYFVKLCLFDCWWALSCVFISDNSGILSLSSSSSFRVVLPFGHYIAFYLHQVISAVLAPHCVVSWGPFAVLCNQV